MTAKSKMEGFALYTLGLVIGAFAVLVGILGVSLVIWLLWGAVVPPAFPDLPTTWKYPTYEDVASRSALVFALIRGVRLSWKI